MEENTSLEQSMLVEIKLELEAALQEKKELELINIKLGYSTMFLSEFHVSKEEKRSVCNEIDLAKNPKEVKEVYEKHRKSFLNEALDENSDDFQWTAGFKDNLRHYFAVSLGYDIVSEVRDEVALIANYFALENKIRSTPDASLRNPMTEKLLEERPSAILALDKIINIINSFD